MKSLFCCAIVWLSPVNPQVAVAESVVEEAKAKVIPWSGYWWPHRQGKMFEPLTKYDRLTQRKATAWEHQNNPAGSGVPAWHGYCHAWAASAVLEPEPRHPKTVKAVFPSGPTLSLDVDDQKGWLALCHTNDVANVFGDRMGDGEGSDDPRDLAPEHLWRLLSLYIDQQGVPLILDLEAGEEVWNYPVYAYRIEYAPTEQADEYLAHLTLTMADNDVPAHFVGLKVRRHTYTFTFRMTNGAVVTGSGQWVGPSQTDHPDFAWYPYLARPENPHVDSGLIQRMLHTSAEATPPETTSPTVPERPPAANTQSTHQPSPEPDSQPARLPLILSPWEVVGLVTNTTSSFVLDASVDRFDGATYFVGETYTLRGTSERSGYLSVFHINPEGKIRLLLPTDDKPRRIPEDIAWTVPAKGENLTFQVPPQTGTHRLKVLVTERPLPFHAKPGSSRLSPTLLAEIKRVLHDSFTKGQPPAAPAVKRLLKHGIGPYAQDEILFYVRSRE